VADGALVGGEPEVGGALGLQSGVELGLSRAGPGGGLQRHAWEGGRGGVGASVPLVLPGDHQLHADRDAPEGRRLTRAGGVCVCAGDDGVRHSVQPAGDAAVEAGKGAGGHDRDRDGDVRAPGGDSVQGVHRGGGAGGGV